MTGHKVVHFKKECISCEACAIVLPDFWQMDGDDKNLAHLKGAKEVSDGVWELELKSEDEIIKNREAAADCPVEIIHVKEIEENSKKD